MGISQNFWGMLLLQLRQTSVRTSAWRPQLSLKGPQRQPMTCVKQQSFASFVSSVSSNLAEESELLAVTVLSPGFTVNNSGFLLWLPRKETWESSQGPRPASSCAWQAELILRQSTHARRMLWDSVLIVNTMPFRQNSH